MNVRYVFGERHVEYDGDRKWLTFAIWLPSVHQTPAVFRLTIA